MVVFLVCCGDDGFGSGGSLWVVGGGCRRSVSLIAASCFSGAPSVAADLHLKDGDVVDEPVDGSDGDGGVREYLIPGVNGLVGGDGEAAVS